MKYIYMTSDPGLQYHSKQHIKHDLDLHETHDRSRDLFTCLANLFFEFNARLLAELDDLIDHLPRALDGRSVPGRLAQRL